MFRRCCGPRIVRRNRPDDGWFGSPHQCGYEGFPTQRWGVPPWVRGCSCAAPGTLTPLALCAPSRTRSAHSERGRAFAAAKSRAHGARDAPFRNLGHYAQGATRRAYCALGARPRTSSGTWWSGWMSPVNLKGVPAIVGMLSFLKRIAGGVPKPFINSSLGFGVFSAWKALKKR